MQIFKPELFGSFVAMLFCLLFCSCTTEPCVPENQSHEQVEVTLKFSARASNANSDPEFQLETVRVYAFMEDEATGEPILAGYTYANLESASAVAEIKMKLPAETLDFYAIGNENISGPFKINNKEDYVLPGPTDGSIISLEQITVTPKDLLSVTFSKLPEPELTSGDANSKDETKKEYKSSLLPMTAIKTAVVKSGSVIDLQMKRSVAKLDLYFSKVGVPNDRLFLGRGLYLYNQPHYGYLFPPETVEFTDPENFEHQEKDDGDKSDSELFQKNGRVILRNGWPEEPANSYAANQHDPQLDINEITKIHNTSAGDHSTVAYQQMPKRSIYLFANPYEIKGENSIHKNPAAESSKGYYLKITAHYHKIDESDNEQMPEIIQAGKEYYVVLPKVNANDHIEIRSAVTVDGYVRIWPDWKVTDWTPAGGDIEFN